MNPTKKICFDKNGDPVVFEEVLTFKVESLNKYFVAYTLGDDLESENVRVNFIELQNVDEKNPTVKEIDDNDWEIVKSVFNDLMKEEN